MAQTANAIIDTIKDEIILKATLDPDWFCEKYLNSPNDPWQSELMNAVADLDRIRLGHKTLFNHTGKNRFSVVAFHGPGKTHAMAKFGLWWGFTRKSRCPCTAPKLSQLKTRLWPELRKLKAGANPALASMISINKTTLTWCGDEDWCMLAETAIKEDNLSGHHDRWLAFLVEEASGISQNLIPTIEGALTTPNAVLVLIGNPTQTTGEFYDSHNKKSTQDQYYQIKIRHEDCSPLRVSPEWVRGMVAKYGRNSPVVRVRVFGEFVDMSEGQLLSLAWLEASRNRSRNGDGSHCKKRISIDVADGGIDESVLTLGAHYLSYMKFVKQTVHSFEPSIAIVDCADAAEQMWKKNKMSAAKGDDFVVDCIGVGTGVAGLLLKRGYPVVLYKGGSTEGVNTDMYRNRRVQSYLCMRDGYRDGEIDTADDFVGEDEWDKLEAQLCTVRSKDGGQRVEDIITKKELKQLENKSLDRPDSCSMQFATQEPAIFNSSLVETFGTMESAQDANI